MPHPRVVSNEYALEIKKLCDENFADHPGKSEEFWLPSLEGFIRQIIGWREFIRGIYQNFGEKQDGEIFWKTPQKIIESVVSSWQRSYRVRTYFKKVFKYIYCHQAKIFAAATVL